MEIDKDLFLKKYKLEEEFKKSQLSWPVLEEIYLDYNNKHHKKVEIETHALINKLYEILDKMNDVDRTKIDTIFGRAKNPEHLIEKIIRKVALENKEKYRTISKENYLSVITDLIGVRILVLAKEDWKIADDLIRAVFKEPFKEAMAYVCYGDRKIFDEALLTLDYTNKGYRSQHYTTDWNGYNVEIQVRTLAEEVHGGLEHRVRYPYRIDNKFLKRYGKVISQNVSQLDALISTCIRLSDETLEVLNEQFDTDEYVDWSQNHRTLELPQQDESEDMVEEEITDALILAQRKLMKR